MSVENQSKLNKLISNHKRGTVLTSAWLISQGYGSSLQARYRNSNWLESIGRGALKLAGDEINYLGGVYALQQQAGLSIHPAGKTAMALSGMSHYMMFKPQEQTLIGGRNEKLPQWFINHEWGIRMKYFSTSFLPEKLGLKVIEHQGFTIEISNAPRAIMECLYLCPKEMDLLECCQLFEGLNNLRPMEVQTLLEASSSVKVNRLFLYLAEKFEHQWFKHLDVSGVKLGTGKRTISTGGILVPKYDLIIPKEVVEYV